MRCEASRATASSHNIILETMDVSYAPDLSVNSLFSRAWAIFREHLGFVLAVFLIYALLTGGVNYFSDDLLGGLGSLIGIIIAGPVTAGAYAVALGLVRGEQPEIGEVFAGFREFGRALGVYILQSLAIVVGMILLIIPGIYIAVALAPAMYLVLNDSLGVTDTLRKAYAMTEGYRWQIFIVGLALILVNILGLIALIVGIIFTGAFSLLVGAVLFDELDKAYNAESVEYSM